MTDAFLAARLFAVDPSGTGGVALRGRWGPARDEFLAFLAGLLPDGTPLRRLPPGIADDRLLGGLDLAATLRARRPIVERGLLGEADGGVLLLPMAERLAPAIVARLASVLDVGTVAVERDGISARHDARIGVVAFDEGATEEERLAAPLADRLAFHVTLGDDSEADAAWHRDQAAAARRGLAAVEFDDRLATALCDAARALGIASMRAPLLALRVARAHAALHARRTMEDSDAAVGARLVLAPRATRLPADRAPATEEPIADHPLDDHEREARAAEEPPTDLILAAARAAIPSRLLARLQSSQAVAAGRAPPGRSGSPMGSTGRGRPAGVRQGWPRGRARLDVLATLRAAAPWQRLRGAGARLEIRPDDFRITRVKQRTASATIFVVDASGSAAVSRLAEAKGAVELLLADCYVRRDEVALIAFRGRAPEIVVPPTRSLVRAKRCLSELPGGGATPLAAAIDMAGAMARSIARKGQLPLVVFLTDGKANMTRDGKAGAAEAERETAAAARLFRAGGTTALVVDTSPRPRPQSERLAADMGAHYLPLPYAGSQELSVAIQASMRQG